jgi:hypothetical protein
VDAAKVHLPPPLASEHPVPLKREAASPVAPSDAHLARKWEPARKQPDPKTSGPAYQAETFDNLPLAEAEVDEFDPDATLVHVRPPLASENNILLRRQGASPIAPSGAQLVGLTGSNRGRNYPIPAAGITVGRHQSCNIVIPDSRVSAHHAWIGIVDGKHMLRDLESTNGTFLNTHTNESVSEAELVSGDTILFGSHQGDQFRFRVG